MRGMVHSVMRLSVKRRMASREIDTSRTYKRVGEKARQTAGINQGDMACTVRKRQPEPGLGRPGAAKRNAPGRLPACHDRHRLAASRSSARAGPDLVLTAPPAIY